MEEDLNENVLDNNVQDDGEGDSNEDDSTSDSDEMVMSKADYETLQERLKKAEAMAGYAKRKADTKPEPSTPSDDAILSRLEARGYLEKEEQDVIMGLSKKTGIHPIELLQDIDTAELVKAKIEGMRKKKETNSAMPNVSGRPTSDRRNELDRWVDKYNKTGEMPDPYKEPELFDKLEEKLGLTRRRPNRN